MHHCSTVEHAGQGVSASHCWRFGWITLPSGVCPVRCGVSSRIPGLHPLDASRDPSPLVAAKNVSQCCQICPGGGKWFFIDNCRLGRCGWRENRVEGTTHTRDATACGSHRGSVPFPCKVKDPAERPVVPCGGQQVSVFADMCQEWNCGARGCMWSHLTEVPNSFPGGWPLSQGVGLRVGMSLPNI